MSKKDKSPFYVPTTKIWERTLKEELRWRAHFYKWLTIVLTLLPILYLGFLWVSSIKDQDKVKADSFFMVSYADVFLETERIARAWDPEAELVEANFDVWPFIDDATGIRAFFTYTSMKEPEDLYIWVDFKDQSYSIRRSYFPIISVSLGNGVPLPADFVFKDSLLAFEYLFAENELLVSQDYLNIKWPMILRFQTQSRPPKWELYYRRGNPLEKICMEASNIGK